MALLQIDYLSEALSRIVTVHMYLPSDTQPEFADGNPHYKRATKTLYLLHGFSGNSTDWVTGSNAMDISRKYNLAIVMPSGENSFYLNRKGTGMSYETFIVEELFHYITSNFGLSKAPEDNFIGGLSMGGFGALRLGAKYNKKYGAIFGLSSAMIIKDIVDLTPEKAENMAAQIADYYYYRSVFGDLSQLEESDSNPEFIIKNKVLQNEKLSPVFMACGTEDFLIEHNRKYRDFLKEMNVDITYKESEGIHDWKFWTEYLEPAVIWAIEKSTEAKVEVKPEKEEDEIPHGDMPGDKVEINDEHIRKSKIVFEELMQILPDALENSADKKVVIAVCGGSGVGKSETASLLSHYLNQKGIGSYTMSGDNYPRRIPMYNDAERLRIFRNAGIKAMVEADLDEEAFDIVRKLQEQEIDASDENIEKYPWFATYLNGALAGLKTYLGTENEINFDEVTDILKQFKDGKDKIWLKRMGRTDSELWYDKVDFSEKNVLIVEWTHGNSDNYQGVDIPILLNSTPEETLAHRRSRNRDGKTDSPFIMKVLGLEQAMLDSQAHKAKIILSKQGKILSYEEYRGLMDESK